MCAPGHLMLVQLFFSEHEGTEIDPRNARYVNDNLCDSSVERPIAVGQGRSGGGEKST
jgi:hypothetical protein